MTTEHEWVDGDDLLAVVPEELRRLPPLTAAEERRLGRLIARGQWAAGRLRAGRRLSPRRLQALRAMVAQGNAARETLIVRNLRLVAHEVRLEAWRARTLTPDDLFQEGCLGLQRAAEKFDWRRGLKFSTYATYWIRQALGRALAEKDTLIRLPVHVHEGVHRTERLRDLWLTMGEKRSATEAARAAGFSPALYARATAALEPLSLERLPGADEEDGRALADVLPAPTPDLDADLLAEEAQAQVARLLRTLPRRTQEILALRWGLVDGRCWTLEEIGRRYHLSRERVRQVVEEARRQLLRQILTRGPNGPGEEGERPCPTVS